MGTGKISYKPPIRDSDIQGHKPQLFGGRSVFALSLSPRPSSSRTCSRSPGREPECGDARGAPEKLSRHKGFLKTDICVQVCMRYIYILHICTHAYRRLSFLQNGLAIRVARKYIMCTYSGACKQRSFTMVDDMVTVLDQEPFWGPVMRYPGRTYFGSMYSIAPAGLGSHFNQPLRGYRVPCRICQDMPSCTLLREPRCRCTKLVVCTLVLQVQ